MSNDDKCPCVDGLPDPCTLCGAPADGVCEIDTLVGWKHRAQRVEAEARQLREAIGGDHRHLIQFAEDGWTIAHPIAERLDLDSLFDCTMRWDDDDPGVRGRFYLNDDRTLGEEITRG